MPRLEGLRKKITSTEQLHSVVKTMKAMAAVNIRQYETAVASLQDYYRTIELGLQTVLHRGIQSGLESEPMQSSRLGGVVLGSDQGMCGQFNEQIVTHTLRELKNRRENERGSVLFAIGHRVVSPLKAARKTVEGDLALPSSIHGVTGRVQQLIDVIEKWRLQKGIHEVVLFYNQYSDSAYHPTSQRLLPLDTAWIDRLKNRQWPTRCIPVFSMEPGKLFSHLLRQYFFVSLYRAFAESMASENASRLRAMQAAEKSIQDRRDELDMQFHRLRQSAITEQLLDVVIGYEALQK